MVAPIRESVNLNSVTYSAMASSSEIKGSEDCEMSSVRGRSSLLSAISSRESSSDSKASSMEYSTHVEQTNNVDTNWANQTDGEIFHIPLSSQRERESIPQAQAALNSNSPPIHVDLISNAEQEQAINNLSPPALSYEEHLPTITLGMAEPTLHPFSEDSGLRTLMLITSKFPLSEFLIL